jgi:chitodextrinase
MLSRFRAFLGVFALAGVPLIGSALATATPASADPVGLGLAGNQFMLGGQPFVPRGFNSISLLNSPWCTSTPTATAAAALTPAELQLAKTTWNANTLRFQVSQPVLAGPNGVAYAQQVETAVNTVLASGFVVDISMQDQSRACGPGEPLPGPETEAAWSTLISNTSLSHDPNVMFELFNEPANQPVSTATTNPGLSTWVDWLSGGRQIGPGTGWAAYVPVGHQDLVNYLRNALNVPNILIADGASKAGYLQGIPLLQDPGGANQIAYAVHPYVYTDGPASWDTRWGYLTASNAVIATEWSYTSSGCSKLPQAMAPQLLAYLRNTVHVGVLGHALDDYTGGLVADGALTPTQCGTTHPGSGNVFLQDYMATFPASVVDAPAAAGGSPPAAPSGLAASYALNQISLSWTAASDPDGAVAGYDVYRDGVLVATTVATGFTDYGVSTGTAHTYTVDAYDTAANAGPPSGPLVAVAPDNQRPSTPTGLKATIATSRITVSWTGSTDNVGVTGYRVSRNGVSLGVTAAKSYPDSAVTQGSSYTYQVVALDAAGNASAASASKTVVFPDTTKPSAPGQLTLTPGKTSITLKWVAASDNVGVKAYRVYRSSTLIATVAGPALTYTNTGLKTGTSYSYHLTAVDAAGNVSAAGATVSAKAKQA